MKAEKSSVKEPVGRQECQFELELSTYCWGRGKEDVQGLIKLYISLISKGMCDDG